MTPDMLASLLDLGGTGLLGALLYLVLQQKFKADEQARDLQREEYKQTMSILLNVITSNTAAMAESAAAARRNAEAAEENANAARRNAEAALNMEKAINGLPEFVQQVIARLDAGKDRLVEHAKRLEKLEQRV